MRELMRGEDGDDTRLKKKKEGRKEGRNEVESANKDRGESEVSS